MKLTDLPMVAGGRLQVGRGVSVEKNPEPTAPDDQMTLDLGLAQLARPIEPRSAVTRSDTDASEPRLRIGDIPGAVVLVDRRDRVLHASPAAVDLLERCGANAPGRPVNVSELQRDSPLLLELRRTMVDLDRGVSLVELIELHDTVDPGTGLGDRAALIARLDQLLRTADDRRLEGSVPL